MPARKFSPRKFMKSRVKVTPRIKKMLANRRRTAKTATPARFPGNYKTYTQTRAVASILKNISETKIQALTPQNNVAPIAQDAGGSGPVFFTAYTLGTAPSAWTGPSGAAAFNNLDGFVWPQGTGPADRNGQYLYLKRTTVNLRVAMNPQSRHGPVKFRLVVFKELRNRYNTTANGNPCDDLFIDQTGQVVGVNNSAPLDQRVMNFNTWLVNKRNYKVVKDFKFILQNETLSALGSTDPFNQSQHYPVEKNIRLNLGHYQKTKFAAGNVPTDQMYRYGMMLISMPISNSTSPHNDYTTYVNGVVSAIDN